MTSRESVLNYLQSNTGGMALRFYDSGSSALYHGLALHLGRAGAGTVMIPSYICDEALLAFEKFGVDVAFYEVGQRAEPDVNDLAARITDDTVAVLSVNYFGFPARKFDRVEQICSENDLMHIEDNAHGLLSESGSALLGTRGDWGIVSIRKTLPVPKGGVLYTSAKVPRRAKRGLRPTDSGYVLRDFVKRLDTALLDGRITQFVNERVGRTERRRDFTMDGLSPLTYRVVERADARKIRRRRRQNYELLSDLLAGVPGVEPLFPALGEGVCPMVLPILADDPEEITRRFRSVNVPVKRWPYLPLEVKESEAFETATWLSRHVLTVPIHQTIEPAMIRAKVASFTESGE